MFAHFTQMPYQIPSQSQSQFNNQPINEFLERSLLTLPEHLSSFLLNKQNLQQKFQQQIDILKQAKQKITFTNSKYEPKVNENKKIIDKYEKIVTKIEPLVNKMYSSLKNQFFLISNHSSYDLSIVDNTMAQVDDIHNAANECETFLNENNIFIQQNINDKCNEFKNECELYTEYLNKQFNEIKDDINNLRYLQSTKQNYELIENQIEKVAEKLTEIMKTLSYIKNCKENYPCNNDSEPKQEQTQQIADCTSNKQHKNCGNKIINGYLKKNRKKQLEKLFY